jgi:hypothetical protein
VVLSSKIYKPIQESVFIFQKFILQAFTYSYGGVGIAIFWLSFPKTSGLAVLCLSLLLPLNLIDSNLSITTTVIPDVYAQTTTFPYFPNLYDPYYSNQFNFNRNPFFITNPTSLALSTLVNAPLGPPFGQQQISPWFPSIPAIACGAGLFSFTITGVPDKDVDIPIADGDNNNGKEKNLVSFQVIRDNNRFRIFDDDVQGQIAVGEKNIERQKWKDFEVEDLFNTCRTLAYSSSPDVSKNIKTPLPTLVLSDDGVPITPLLAALAINRNTYNPYAPYYSTTTGYPNTSPYYPTSTSSVPSTSNGGCSPSYPDVCIQNPPPQLACWQVPYTNFRVLSPDPHRFDENRDGRGCER